MRTYADRRGTCATAHRAPVSTTASSGAYRRRRCCVRQRQQRPLPISMRGPHPASYRQSNTTSRFFDPREIYRSEGRKHRASQERSARIQATPLTHEKAFIIPRLIAAGWARGYVALPCSARRCSLWSPRASRLLPAVSLAPPRPLAVAARAGSIQPGGVLLDAHPARRDGGRPHVCRLRGVYIATAVTWLWVVDG